jgi:hypothetical protein
MLVPAVLLLGAGILSLLARRHATRIMILQIRRHPSWYRPRSLGAWEAFARVYPYVFAGFAFALGGISFAVAIRAIGR